MIRKADTSRISIVLENDMLKEIDNLSEIISTDIYLDKKMSRSETIRYLLTNAIEEKKDFLSKI